LRRFERKLASVKQPISGLKGIKPRPPKPHGNGKIDRQEAHALDVEYRKHRNQALRAKNDREQMRFAKDRGELIEKRIASLQASFLLGNFKQRVLQEPSSLARRLISAGFIEAKLRLNVELMVKDDLDAMLTELSELPEKVVASLDDLDDDHVHVLVEDNERVPTGEIKAEQLKRRPKKMRQARRAREKQA
jgi:hypothetical protein